MHDAEEYLAMVCEDYDVTEFAIHEAEDGTAFVEFDSLIEGEVLEIEYSEDTEVRCSRQTVFRPLQVRQLRHA